MKVLLLNQCFHPDHVATAQHLTDLALELVKRGHQVTVVASSRGYDDPSIRYPVRETWRGIDIRRIWTPGLGKKAKWRRLIDFAMFWGNAKRILFFLPRQDVTVCLTSPPLISTLGTVVAKLKGGAVVPWVMDLNPDEAVAAGWLKAGGIVERTLSFIQNWSFRRASRIIALDRFMAERLKAKGVREEVIHVDAPWSHDQAIRYDAAARDAFRAEHGLTEKFVVMYSGNHSPCHPLDTVLATADEMKSDERLHFLFVGGGSEFKKVQAFAKEKALNNITCLPYQPMEKLSGSLSAADLHLVVMGDPFVGIVHPCKIYNILTLGIPFLFIGPEQSHGADLARRLNDTMHGRVAHNGERDAIVKQIREAMALGPRPVNEAAQALGAEFSHAVLCPRLAQIIEQAAARA
ncbi:glycosyltransferase family 4 protein [Prosthecobacter sp.]|uniref:glycosyltransferase family 4 protein n=1 Tax=Prosthecobacter sp. TaxID=1965333 RepID=UPI002ABBB954|nr:glycosyltransferase family 4 protein [Prosthecobacter sp.]MDZ4401072.1 glycosyltransferase family 4 protein [Prosthecobacter sp.]